MLGIIETMPPQKIACMTSVNSLLKIHIKYKETEGNSCYNKPRLAVLSRLAQDPAVAAWDLHLGL